ncbi:MAG: sulfatase [Chloroflexota bacterium]
MNIILLISDTFRYDNLFDRAVAMPVRTPNLDRFSQRAVSLERLYMASFPTIPHRTDLTTGRFGWPFYPWQDRFLSGNNHLPIMLREAGYVSQILGDCPHLARARFDHGFDGATFLQGQEGNTNFLRMNEPIPETMPREKTRTGFGFQGRNLPDIHSWTNIEWRYETDRFAPRTAELAVRWLEENYAYDPFFLWVDFFDPHEPWDPPEYMVKRYDPEYDGVPMIHPNYGKASDLTDAELRNLRAHYCAEAEMVDRAVGRILDKIDDLQLWENSIVVFMADHGMSLGEHNRTGKSNINDQDDRYWPVYPEVAHEPCMIAAPGLTGGTSVDAILQPVDFLPTLIELANLDVIPPDPMHGKSFAAHLRGESTSPVRDYAVTASHIRSADSVPPNATTPVVYTKEWAYVPIGPDGERELYHLTNDYYAEKNVIAAHRNVAEEIHGMFMGFLENCDAPEETIALFKR